MSRNPAVGVVAQDVEKVFPELVTTGRDGYKRVNYIGLIGPLIEAVKELDQRMSAIEAQLKTSHPDPQGDKATPGQHGPHAGA